MKVLVDNHTPVRVAVLGFSVLRYHQCRLAAFYLGQYLAKSGYEAIGGNITGVFADVFRGVRSGGGHSCALLEKGYGDVRSQLQCERLRFVSSAVSKHRLLTCMADMAVVIGGGPATKLIISELVNLQKPVWALAGSGGIVERELHSEVLLSTSMEEICIALGSYSQQQFCNRLISNAG